MPQKEEVLLKNGAESDELTLKHALEAMDAGKADLLLKAGARAPPKKELSEMLHNITQREHCCYEGIIPLLVRLGADVDGPGLDRSNFSWPIYKGRKGIIAALLECGANPNLIVRGGNITPTVMAVESGWDHIQDIFPTYGGGLSPPVTKVWD
jgi:hypothetical protein